VPDLKFAAACWVRRPARNAHGPVSPCGDALSARRARLRPRVAAVSTCRVVLSDQLQRPRVATPWGRD